MDATHLSLRKESLEKVTFWSGILRSLVVMGERINGCLLLLEVGGWLEGLGGEIVFASRRVWLIIWNFGRVFILELLV